MKFILLFLLFTQAAFAQWIYGPGTAQNLENKLTFKNLVSQQTGSVDPTSVAVSAPAGSLYLRTNGTLYIKTDAGLSTNWTDLAAGGGGGVSSIGTINSTAKSANGATISGTSIVLQEADGSAPGLVSTGAQTFSGEKTFSSIPVFPASLGTGFVKSSSGVLTTASIAASDLPSGIDATKIADGSISNTEFESLNNISGNIQTLLDSKQVTITGAATTIDNEDLTASRVLTSNASGKVEVSSVTTTTLGYVDATSSIQTQIDGKQASGNYITQTTGDVLATGPGIVTATIAPLAVTNSKIANSTIDLTAKVTGVLPIANGGTNKALTLTSGGIVYSDADSFEVTSPGTSGQVLTSNGPGNAPTFQAVSGSTPTSQWYQARAVSGYGSTNTNIRVFSNANTTGTQNGTYFNYTHSGVNGDSVTINTKAWCSFGWTDYEDSNTTVTFGFSKNSTELTTAVTGITAAHVLHLTKIPGSGSGHISVYFSGVVESGDVIRPHVSAASLDGDPNNKFYVACHGVQ